MTEQRHELQTLLDRAADRLNEIAHSMRQALPTAITGPSEARIPSDALKERVPSGV
jgi:hypothetical protein